MTRHGYVHYHGLSADSHLGTARKASCRVVVFVAVMTSKSWPRCFFVRLLGQLVEHGPGESLATQPTQGGSDNG